MRTRLVFSTVLALGLLMALALPLASPVAAQDVEPGRVIFGAQYTLESGQRMDGDLAVVGGQAVIEEGAIVDGDVVVMGGSLAVSGRIDGDIAIFGGAVDLARSAVVDGDIVTLGGSVTQAPGAEVTGEVREGGAVDIPGLRNLPIGPGVVVPRVQAPEPDLQRSPGMWLLAVVLKILRLLVWTLAITAMALVVALLWPKGIERMGRTGIEQPAMAFLTGLISWILGLVLVVIMAVTLCLLPVALLLALVLLVASLLSWVIAGWVLGRKLMALFTVKNPTVVLETVVGTLLLTVVYFLLSVIPCMNFIIGLVVGSFGLGVIVLTRLGTRPYPPSGQAGPPPASPDQPQLSAPQAPESGPPAVYTAAELGLPPRSKQ